QRFLGVGRSAAQAFDLLAVLAHHVFETRHTLGQAAVLATVAEQAGGGVGVERGGNARLRVAISGPVEQQPDLLVDAQSVALRKRAPLARLALLIVLIQSEADQLIFVDGVGYARELRHARTLEA